MRLRSLALLLLAALPLAAGTSASASASVTIRTVSKEWLASNDSRLLASPRSVTAPAAGMTQENGTTYLLLNLNGRTFRFEVPAGTSAPDGTVRIDYVPLVDEGHQRLVAMAINGRGVR